MGPISALGHRSDGYLITLCEQYNVEMTKNRKENIVESLRITLASSNIYLTIVLVSVPFRK